MILRSLGAYLTEQSYRRVARIVRHAAGLAASGIMLWMLWDIHMNANATTLASELVASMTAITIYQLAGIKGLRVYERASTQATNSDTVETEQQTITSVGPAAESSRADDAPEVAK